jgi:hypothetical protein
MILIVDSAPLARKPPRHHAAPRSDTVVQPVDLRAGSCRSGRARASAVTSGRQAVQRNPRSPALQLTQLRWREGAKGRIRLRFRRSRGAWTPADEDRTILRMITVQYETKRNGEHTFWVGRHGSHSMRIDANRPGVYRWMITRDGRPVASGVAPDRDQAANDAAAALGELPR